MGKDDPVALYIAAYDDPAAAREDYDALRELVKAGAVFVDVAVLVRRDDDGTLHVEEDSHEVGKGAILGTGAGLLIGLIFPPGLIVAGIAGGAAGAGVGKLVKHHHGTEIENEIDATLPPGTSGIVALFDVTWKPKVDETLKQATKVDQEEVSPESAAEFRGNASGTG